MKNFDLHFHSVYSDGENTYEELIKRGKELELDFMSITDHDTITKNDFYKQAHENGIQTCASVEISARNYRDQKSLHLTCYAEKFSQDIEDVLYITKEKKIGMIYAQLQKMVEKGFVLNIDKFYDFYQQAGKQKEGLNKYNIAEYLFREEGNKVKASEIAGRRVDIIDFFRSFLKEGGEFYEKYGVKVTDYEPSIEVCGQLAQSNKAILSIAHPNFTFSRDGITGFEEKLPQYIAAGVNAIEINSMATRKWIDTIYRAKNQYGLIITAGSDSHKIGRFDDKHTDFGKINPLLSPGEREIILKDFMAYL